jgi:hypothetical protein
MFSTVSLLYFGAFVLWMNTSQRIAWPQKNKALAYLAGNARYSRLLSVLLTAAASILCIKLLGLGSGLFGGIVLLMTAGSLAVLLFPFHYFGVKSVLLLYCLIAMLEIITS